MYYEDILQFCIMVCNLTRQKSQVRKLKVRIGIISIFCMNDNGAKTTIMGLRFQHLPDNHQTGNDVYWLLRLIH